MSMSFDFSGRTVAVTGAAQGIGLAVARSFHDAGARVVAVDRDEDALTDSWSAAAQDTVLPIGVDVADEDAVTSAVAQAEAWAGGIDVMVNNAGITRDVVVWKMTSAQWRAVLDVHLTGTFHFTRAVIPRMRQQGWGRVVNVTSYTGMHGMVGQANYAAAKAGLIGFTKATAKEVARFGITVNAVSPNASTAMVAAIPADKLAALTESVPMGRFAEPREMSAAFQFLASDEAAYVTGTVLPVDGGVAM
ncbi:3-oxoacyl-ACP reductase FabG [Nocardioides humi]|uniref:3-oxoacyl-[acyl-carrier-protein] reductase n=1 Tax=Nocardioides humi TaxID=449461 RepID=A0ABN2BVM4_9ACTN|nr:3-oxoacyl-ACP reductase FabG [Nocardioides humi]